MNRNLIRRTLVLFACLGVAMVIWAQTRPQTSPRSTGADPTPMAEPTNPVPSSAMTPGTGSLTPGYQTSPSGTPGYGSNLYGIPPTTPQGMPTYSQGMPTYSKTQPAPGSMTPSLTMGGMGAAAQPRPTSVSDCGNDGWRSYAALKFKSQKGCEAWVKKHPAGATGVGTPTMPTTPGRARMLATPRMRTTPGAMSPGYSGTPGSSITPFRDVTPGPAAH